MEKKEKEKDRGMMKRDRTGDLWAVRNRMT